MRQAGDDCPRAVGAVAPGREVRERLIFEVADRELDDGVLAMLGLDDADRRCGLSETRSAARCRRREPRSSSKLTCMASNPTGPSSCTPKVDLLRGPRLRLQPEKRQLEGHSSVSTGRHRREAWRIKA